MLPPEPDGFADLLARLDPPIAALGRRLRAVALTAMPDLDERFLAGWRALGLRHPEGGHLLGIFPRTGDTTVYFEHGASLPDPHELLTGTGKRTRVLVFLPDGQSPTDDQFVEYLDLALEQALSKRRQR
jgi:hypothetical protein